MIRPLAAADRADWQRLFRDYGEFYETRFDDEVIARVWTLLTADGSGIDALVAEESGRVVGIAHYRSHPDTFTGGRDFFLDDLYVEPAARGAGHATALIEGIVAIAASEGATGGTLRWITAHDNAPAQRVYDRVATRTTWVTYERRL